MKPANRILRVASGSCVARGEIALNPKLQERPVWVGGRPGGGIVIAANRPARKTVTGQAFSGK